MLLLALAPPTAWAAGGFGTLIDQFSLTPGSPEIGATAPPNPTEGDLIAFCVAPVCVPVAPAWAFPAAFGLAAPPVGQNVIGLSLGAATPTTFPPPLGNELAIDFSIALGSAGLDPTIIGEVALDGGAEDIWQIRIDGAGTVFGPYIAEQGSPPPPGAGITLGLTPFASDVDAWVDVGPLGLLQHFFTIDAATAAANGLNAATVYLNLPVVLPGNVVFAAPGALGIAATDVIDALDVADADNSNTFNAGDVIYFSLVPGSTSLLAGGALAGRSAADVFVVAFGAGPAVWATSAQLGLLAGDDVDALQVYDPTLHVPSPSVPAGSPVGRIVLLALLLTAGGLCAWHRGRPHAV